MGNIPDFFKTKKNLVSLLVLGILILGIPLGVNLVRLQQIVKSRAAVESITFTGLNVKQKSDGTWVAAKPQIQLQLTSPLGPPGGTLPSPTPAPGGSTTPAPTSTSTSTPTPTSPPQPLGNSNVYIDPNPAASGSRVVMIATAIAGCDTYINFNPGNGLINCPTNFEVITCGGGNPKDSHPCWWKKTCTAGSPGTYIASFNARGSNCASDLTYTIR